MIQEIFDYLWIKSCLISFDKDDFKNSIDNYLDNNSLVDKSLGYNHFLTCVTNLLDSEEEYFSMSESIIDDVKDIINEYRYEDKILDSTIKSNNIIIRLNKITNLPQKQKTVNIAKYFKKEIDERKIPFALSKSVDNLTTMISRDIVNVYHMLGIVTGEQVEFTNNELACFVSTVNSLLSKNPEFFVVFDNNLDILNSLTINKRNKSHYIKKYTENTIERYKTILEEIRTKKPYTF